MKTLFKYFLIVFITFSCNNTAYSQKTLQILKVRFGSFKKYEIFSGDYLVFKLKGKHFYTRKKIVNMNDSMILFEDDLRINLSQIKVVKFNTGNHLMETFTGAFMIGGLGYLTLNFLNNLILEKTFTVDRIALFVSGSFLLASFILKQLGMRRIRIKKRDTVKVLELNFQKLN